MSCRNFLFLFLASLLFLQAASAASNLDIYVSPDDVYVRSGQSFTLTYTPTPFDDDGEIDATDLYNLDTSTHHLSVSSISGVGWTHTRIGAFDDEQFSNTSVTNQTLQVTYAVAGAAPEGREDVVCYYQFSDTDGSETGLGDNMPLQPKNDSLNNIGFSVYIDNTPPVVNYIHTEGYALVYPVNLFDGVNVEAEVFDANPLNNVTYYYGAAVPNTPLAMSGNLGGGTQAFTATIPAGSITENQAVFYYVSATDMAGNTVTTPTSSFIPWDNPQISNVQITSTLPNTNIDLSAVLRDFSGINSATLSWKVNGLAQPSKSLKNIGGDNWQVSLGQFNERDFIEFTITATDPFGHIAQYSDAFTILYSCQTTFNVKDFITNNLLDNVSLDISAQHIVGSVYDYWIPAEHHVFNQTINLTQYQGTYTYTFNVAGYDQKAIARTLSGNPCTLSEDILMGQPTLVDVSNVTVSPSGQCSETGASELYLDISATIASTYTLTSSVFKYGLDSDVLSNQIDLTLSDQGNDVYTARLGPFTSSFTLYGRVEAQDQSNASDFEDINPQNYFMQACAVSVPDSVFEAEGITGAAEQMDVLCEDHCPDCGGSVPICLIGEFWLNFRRSIGVGQIQKVQVLWLETEEALPATAVEVTNPLGESMEMLTDEDGFIEFEVDQPGEWRIKAKKANLSRTEKFNAFDLVSAIEGGAKNLVNPVSKEIAQQPKIYRLLWFTLLLILCGIAGLMAFEKFLPIARGLSK